MSELQYRDEDWDRVVTLAEETDPLLRRAYEVGVEDTLLRVAAQHAAEADGHSGDTAELLRRIATELRNEAAVLHRNAKTGSDND